jgi:23S rRNA pseudouridine1911/1915/1917 synthase
MNQEIKIVFENENFIVFNKPSGLIVNRSQTVKDSTLQDYLEENIEMESDDDQESEFNKRNGIVHRLDKDTSGIILVAKNDRYFAYLQSLFKERQIKKEYLAVVLGKVDEERFEIDAPIGRDPKSRFRYAIVRGEKDSQTFFEREKITESDEKFFTSLKCFPKTGRTHQIRVHLAAYGFPILGDSTYSSARDSEFYAKIGINRLMLHSKSVTFNDMDGEVYSFECETPDEFSKFM